MILLAAALLLAALVLTGALIVGWIADRYAIKNNAAELDEQEVERLLYPDGNVLLLERRDPDDQGLQP